MNSTDTFERAIDPFFFERLTAAAAAVVEANAVRIRAKLEVHAAWAPLNCDLASAAWTRAFAAAGVPVSLRHGSYDPAHTDGVVHPASSEHTWLRVAGRLFDPTAGQFGSPINPAAYFDDERPHGHIC